MDVMRTHRGLSVVLVTVLAGATFGMPSAVAGQQPDQAKGAAVLAEARKALGGEDKLAAVKRLQANGTSRRAQGNFNLEGDTEIFVELPDKFRRNESLNIGAGGPGIERKEGFNGTDFWSETSGDLGGRGRGRFGGGGFPGAPGGAAPGATAPGNDAAAGRGGQPPVDPERLREAQRRNLQAEVSRLLLGILLTSDAPVAWVGTAQSPDGSADVLEVKTPDGVDTRLFIDTATHMPLMLTWSGRGGLGGRGGQGRGGPGGGQGGANPAGAPPAGDQPAAGAPPAGVPPAGAQPAGPDQAQGRRGRGPQGPPVTLEMHLAEYKTVNGIKLPHLITRGTGGETNEEWTIKSYKINPSFKANTFTK